MTPPASSPAQPQLQLPHQPLPFIYIETMFPWVKDLGFSEDEKKVVMEAAERESRELPEIGMRQHAWRALTRPKRVSAAGEGLSTARIREVLAKAREVGEPALKDDPLAATFEVPGSALDTMARDTREGLMRSLETLGEINEALDRKIRERMRGSNPPVGSESPNLDVQRQHAGWEP